MAGSMSKWLAFDKCVRDPGKKTDFWHVYNKVTNVTIGAVYWYGGFRKYIFAPNANIILDASCMNDISQFLTSAMDEWKQNKKLKLSQQ